MTARGARRARSRRGYTLVALLVFLTAMTVLIAAVLPLASAQAQRTREAELIFRGNQIAEGIRVFRRKYGRYPTSVKEMVTVRPRTLRKAWKDPMTEKGEWGIISLAGAPLQGQGQTGLGGSGKPSPTPVPTPTPWPGTANATGSGQPGGVLGPVMGVYSTSTEKGYLIYQGRENYNDWRFTEQTIGQTGTNPGYDTPGGGAGPGMPGVPPPGGGTTPKK